MTRRLAIYCALSALLGLPLLVDRYFGAVDQGSRSALLWLGLLAMLWISFPAYRSFRLRQFALTISLIAVVNVPLTPVLRLLQPEPTPIQEPNIDFRLAFEGDTLVGMHGVHHISTNAHGHRTNGPIDYDRKPPGALRIVAVGASTTENPRLDDMNTWPSLVGALVGKALGRKVEVINTGVSGTRAEQQLAALRDSAAYAPDIAIFMTGINDWNRAITKAVAPWSFLADAFENWRFYDSPLWRGVLAAKALIVPPRAEQGVLVDDGSWERQRMEKAARVPKLSYRLPAVDAVYASAVERIMVECRNRDLLCLFVDQATSYGPDFAAAHRLWMTPPGQDYALPVEDLAATAGLYNAWLGRKAQEAGMAFCPVAQRLPPTTAIFFDDCHFNDDGSPIVADLISACLLEALKQR